MNEIEYILRILLKARDETAAAFKTAREQLRLFVNAADTGSAKLDKFNASMATMERNMTNVTSKIKEWRAVLQGMSDDNDDSAKSIGRIGKETDTYVKSVSRAVRSQKDLAQSSSDLSRSLDEYGKKVKANNYDNERAITGYKQLAQQLDAVAKKQNAGTDAWNRTIQRAQRARQAIADIIKAQEDEAKSAEDTARRKKVAYDDAFADFKKTVDEEIRANDAKNKSILASDREALRERARLNSERARASAEQTRIEFENSQKQVEYIKLRNKAEQESIDIQERISRSSRRDRGSAANVVALKELAKAHDVLANHIGASSREQEHFRVRAEEVRRTVTRLRQDNNTTSSSVTSLAKSFLGGGNGIATFDNKLRGLGLVLAAGFAQQLMTVIIGLGGQFVALAGSAAQAGVAIGGIFVAGVMQAIPVIGLLGAAFAQVKSVMDAVKQAQLERQQASVQGQQADRRNADAADAVANANRRLREAQENLTKARKEARRDLQDLIAAENQAKLAAVGAALSQAEAQEALVQAQARGDVGGIQRAQLAVLEAQADAEDKLRDKRRASADAEKGRRGGPEGMEGVQQAKQQVADAQRGLASAKRNADEAAQGTQSAAQKLNFLLAQMTKGQRDLFHALEDLSKVYKETFGPITDIILNSFTRAARRITTLIQMPELVKGAKSLATEISDQFDNIFDSFTSDKAVAQFLRIADQARQNLKPVSDIIIDLGHSFADIGEAAGPAFSDLIDYIGDLVDKFKALVSDKDSLTKFFEDGEKHFEAWVDLGLSVIKLFAALTGAGGAESGLTTIEDATKAIDGLTEKVNDNKEAVSDFFEDARRITYRVVGVLVTLGKELFKAFTPERVDGFAKLLTDVIIPALGDAIDFLGDVTEKILEIADTPIGEQVIKFGIAWLVVSKIFGAFFGSFLTFAGSIVKIGGLLGGILTQATGAATAMEALSIAAGPLLMAVGIIAAIAAIVLLLDHLGLLDDAVDEIKKAFSAFWDEVGPQLGKLAKAAEDFWDALAKGKGLAIILRPILQILIRVGGAFLQTFGRTIGRVLGGFIQTLTGVIEVVTALLTGDWAKAWEGAKDILRGTIRVFTAMFRALPELIWNLLRGVIRRAARALGDLAESFARWGRRAVSNFLHFLRELPGKLGDFFSKLPGRLKDFGEIVVNAIGKMGKDAAAAFIEPFKDIGKGLIKVITQIFQGDFKGAAKGIANALIDLLNFLLPDKLGPIGLPDNPIKHMAEGGGIPGYGGGDRVAALLEAGEHVLTKEEVRAAGGHLAVFALRRALGGGGQGIGGRFQPGGAVAGAGSLSISFHGGDLDDFQSQWREFWQGIVTAARRGANAVEDQFRDMRVNTARQADLMYLRIRGSIADIQHSFDVRGKKIVDSWSDTWQSLKKVAYDGLNYIGHQTNLALTGLGEKAINFNLTLPKKASADKAGGGFIQGKGQRGRDQGFYALGAGEAVLNWQHQNYVEPAMNAYYGHGLTDMFKRTRGYHAGGPEQPGFAAGGMAEIDKTGKLAGNDKLARVIVSMMRRWKFAITAAGEQGHSANSDHHWGGALDLVPGPGGSWALLGQLAKAAGWRPGAPMPSGGPFRWIGWNTEGGHGDPSHGAGGNAHLHLSWRRGGPFVGPGGKDGGDVITEIGRVFVNGIEPLKDIVQKGLDLFLKAANQKIEETDGAGGSTADTVPLGPGGAAEKVFDYFVNRGLSEEIAAGFVGTFQKESNFSTTVGNRAGSGATGLAQWLGGRLAKLQSKENWQSLQVQLDYVWEELLGSESAAFAAIKRAKTPAEAARIIDSAYERSDNILSAPENAQRAFQRFASSGDHGPRKAATGKVPEFERGGIVPGPGGSAVPIIAHAQEWVLNRGQVRRIAGMIGTSTDALRSMMGFYGGPGGAAGGTEVKKDAIDPTEIAFPSAKIIGQIGDKALVGLIFALRRVGKHIDDMAARSVRSVVGWSQSVDQTFSRLDNAAVRLKQVSEKVHKKAMSGFIAGLNNLTKEGGVFDSLRTSIELATTQRARRRQLARFEQTGTRAAPRFREVANVAVVSAQAELEALQGERRPLTDERADIRTAIKKTLDQLKQKQTKTARDQLRGQLNNLRTRMEDAEQRVADSTTAIFEAQQAYLQAQMDAQNEAVDKITTAYDRASKKADNFRRIADALGTYIDNDAMIESLAVADQNRVTNYAAQLQAQIQGFKDIGTPEALARADELADQVEDLQTQVVEMTAQALNDAISRVGERLQRNLGHLDRGGRLLDALGVVGLTGAAVLSGGMVSRSSIGAARGTELTGAREQYIAQRDRASREGNIKAVQELNDTIEDLDVQIAENTKAIFDARIAEVTSGHDYIGTMLGLEMRIIELDGTINGVDVTAAKLAKMQEIGNNLAAEGVKLQALLAEATPGTSTYQDLAKMILENTIAQKENTVAVNELSGATKQPQTFSTSAWQWFREAVFSGMGQVLPQYDTSLMGGVNTGAMIVPGGTSNQTTGGDVNLTINEAGGPIDIPAITGAITFASKTAQ